MPFAPTDIAGCKIWLKADAGAGSSDSDPVGTWADQSGTSHNFTQATSGKRPLYRTGKRNGLPAVVFDGSDDELSGGDLSALFSSAGSVFCAANGTGSNHWAPYATGANDAWWSFEGAGYWGPFRSSRLGNTPASGMPFNGWHIWSQTGDGTAYKVWIDLVNVINSGSYTHAGGTAHLIGHQTSAGNYMAMEFGELIVYDTALSDADRASVETYLAERWGSATATPSTVVGVGAVPTPGMANDAYSREVFADNPIAYWRLDEASGLVAADFRQQGRDGAYIGSPTLNQTGLLVISADAAVLFDGTDDNVDLTNNAALRVSTAWTLEAWVKINSGDSVMGTALCAAYDGTVRFALDCFNGSGHSLKPSVGFYDGTWRIAQSASSISTGAVHHLVGTWDGTTLKIYVDGSLVASNVPGVSVPTTSTSTHYIGRRWDSGGDGRFFHGILDEVAIYGTDIGATRIAAHYTVGLTNPNGTATPAVVAGAGGTPGSTAVGSSPATVTPGTTVGTGAMPASSATGAAFAAPGTVAGVGAVAASSGKGASSVSPNTTTGIGAVPVPAAFGAGSGVATPNATAGVGATPAPTLFGVALVAPVTVVGSGAVPAPTTVGSGVALPMQVAGTGVVPGPNVGAIQNATVTPDNVIGFGRVPHPYAVGQGTGGGGGSINGVTDYWAIKALG